MSTDLYGIRIQEVDPAAKRLRLRVFVVYYETALKRHPPIPTDRSFFVRLLCAHDALGADIAHSDQFDENYVNRNAFRYVDHFKELSRSNDPIADYQGYSDFYYAQNDAWQDEEKLAQADYDVFLTKAGYLESFGAGDSWGSTCYQTDSDDLGREDYLQIPDFTPAATFTPFADLGGEVLADRLVFSADASQLLVDNSGGNFRVFSTADWSTIGEVLDNGAHSPAHAGWIEDGKVLVQISDDWVAFDVESGKAKLVSPPGYSANSEATRFVARGDDDEYVKVFDEQGNELFSDELEEGVWISFDRSGDRCVIAPELQPLRLIDLKTKNIKELASGNFYDVGMSPDGSYLVATDFKSVSILSTLDGKVLRRLGRGTGCNGHFHSVAWSPDGKNVAVGFTDNVGDSARVMVLPIGSECDAKKKV